MNPPSLEALAKLAVEIAIKDKRPVEQIAMGTVSELGEFCEAVASEDNHFGRKRPLKEPSRMEAADIVVAGIALYMIRGGRSVDLAFDVETKMRKWLATVDRLLAEKAVPDRE